MDAGTFEDSGRMAGAARPVTCATHLLATAAGAPMYQNTWLQGSNGMHTKWVPATFPVFITDRPTRRLSERFP